MANKSGDSYIAEASARRGLESIFRKMDRELKEKSPSIPKTGSRKEFLERYKRDGYEVAKAQINAGFNGREVYTDSIISEWLGFKQKIVDTYKKGTIQDAYIKADKINEEVGYPLVKKEYIDMWIAEEIKKEKKEVNQKNTGENDGSR